MKKKILIIALIIYYSGYSQNVHNDILAIRNAMSSEIFAANILYKSFLDGKNTESQKSNILVNKNQYKVTISNYTKINNKDYNITIDNLNDVIVVAKAENNLEKISQLPALDSFLKKSESVSFSKTDSIGKYIFTLKNFPEKKVELEFDMQTFLIKKILIVMSEKELDNDGNEHEKSMEIQYLTYNKGIEINNSNFITTGFVVKKGDIFLSTGKYKTYRIIDLIHSEK